MKKLLALISLACLLLPFPASAQEKFRRQPPLPDPLPTLSLPAIENHTLANNLRLRVAHKTGFPVINLSLVVLTGESLSPDAKPGLATFTANMVSRGSFNFSASEVQETIDSIGGRFTTQTNPDYTIFSLSCLQENLDQALELLSDMLVRPSFSRRQIEDLQRVTFYDLTRRREDPEFSGKKLLYQLLFKDHVYQKIVYNDNIIRTYTLGDIRGFYENYYRPDNAILIITGDIDLNQASRKVSRNFNTWEKKTVGKVTLPAPELDATQRICFLQIPRAKDINIFMGTLIPPKTNEDFFSLGVMNQVLGGTYISRLFMNLRESKGYAYDAAFSYMEFYRICGVFYVHARVTPESIRSAIDEIRREIRIISTQRVPNEEIETAKSYLLGRYPMGIQTHEELSARIADVQALGLSDGHWDNYYENITRIDSRSVYEAAQRHSLLTPIIIIVGDESVLETIGYERIDVYNSNGELIQSVTKGGRQ
jgi:predicted Zn-dependent peptidase